MEHALIPPHHKKKSWFPGCRTKNYCTGKAIVRVSMGMQDTHWKARPVPQQEQQRYRQRKRDRSCTVKKLAVHSILVTAVSFSTQFCAVSSAQNPPNSFGGGGIFRNKFSSSSRLAAILTQSKPNSDSTQDSSSNPFALVSGFIGDRYCDIRAQIGRTEHQEGKIGVRIVGNSGNGGEMATVRNGGGGLKVNGYNSFAAGGLAGSIATTITCPIEVVKTQLQASSVRRGSNALSIAGQIFKTEGAKGFFRGLLPGLVGIIPARSTYFLAYSKSKEFWKNDARLGDRHLDLTEIFCGVTAGIVQNTITNPIWMVKTRMQLIADTATGQVAYGGYQQAVRAIWNAEGFKGFYKGMSASYWGCSEGCLYFVLYERLKRRLRERHNDERAKQGLARTDTLPPLYLFASSAASKCVATITTYPHEVIRTRLREQARNGVYKYTGMWQSLILIGREEGRRGLYAGMGTHVARVVPNMAIMMLSFELISDWLNRQGGIQRLPLLKNT